MKTVSPRAFVIAMSDCGGVLAVPPLPMFALRLSAPDTNGSSQGACPRKRSRGRPRNSVM
jgi:hypothetical protein